MGYPRLFLLVEGTDDQRFFEKIIKPKLVGKYNYVHIWPWAENEKKVDSFIHCINAMNADYFFVVDINSSPCVTGKKQKIKNKHTNIDEGRIIVVVKEIESWYLAGLDVNKARRLGIRNFTFSKTDGINKEEFNKLIPTKKFGSRIYFLLEILKFFSADIAIKKNESFKYFIEKCS